MRTNKKTCFLVLISFFLLPCALGAQINASVKTFSDTILVKENHLNTQKTSEATSSQSIEADQTVARSFQENSTKTIQAGHQMLQFSSTSNSSSFTRHVMCKSHNSSWDPIEPTTIFRPSDAQAECLTTVSIDDTIEFRWYYRSDLSKTWISCYNWSDVRSVGQYHYEGHFLIAGYWPGTYYPRAYKVEVYLDGNFSFSEFFEVTNGGLNSPRMCEDIDANEQPVNMKSRFTIGTDTKAYHYLRFDKIAYFNEELECCHNFTTVWIQPDGNTYNTSSGSFNDYKDTNVTWNYWKYGYTQYDYVTINSSTPVGNWKVEVYLDSYFNNTWMPYGPIATTPFVVGNTTVADWTFMVYLDADIDNKTDTEQAGIATFLNLASIGSSSKVNIVVQMDRIFGHGGYGNWTDCKRFYVTKDMTPMPENAVQNLTEVNMGDSDTLKSFVNWTIYYYPANYYCLVLWDHGAGVMGLCLDFTPPPTDCLFLPELSQALSGLPAIMDVILIDACSMGMVEVGYQIRDYANVLVAPEGIGYAPSPYDSYVASLTNNPLMSANTFAKEVVNDYIAWCNSIDEIPEATMSATDLAKIVSLTATIDDFAIKLKEKETPYHNQISLVRNLTEGYPGPYENQSGYYIDLYHFAQLTHQYVQDEELRDTADQVMTALSIGNAIIIERHKAHLNSHGLAIFFPDKKDKYQYDEFDSLYEETIFAIDSSWDEFVKHDLSGYVLTIQTPYSDIPLTVDEELYTTDVYGKIHVFVLPTYVHIINVTTPFLIEPGVRILFTQWNDSDTSNPRLLYVSRPLTLQAQYKTQYLLIINTNFGTTDPPVGEYWREADSNVTISATAPNPTSGEQYVWLGWIKTGNGSQSSMNNPDFTTMDKPINETATWRHDYYLTVPSMYGSPTPTSGWYEGEKPINASVASPVLGLVGTRYACTGWTGTGSVPASGANSTVTFVISEPSSITWNWKTQHLLSVGTNATGLSPQPELSPPGPWYDNGTLVNCTAQKISEYTFDYWSVDGTNLDRGINPITITMNGPHEATAYYVRVAAWWEMLLRPETQIIIGLVGVVAAVVLARTAWIRTLKRRGAMKPRIEPPAIGIPTVVLPGRITSGYDDLDNLLFGGIPQNYAVILTSPACDERDLLIKKFLEAGAKQGQITFYVTIEARGVSALVEEFQSNFYLFICNPRADTMIKSLPNVFKLKGVENLTEIIIALTKAFRTLDSSPSGPRRACIEIVSDILLQHHPVQTRRWLTDLIPELRSRGFTTLAVMNPQMHPSEEVHAILDLFEGEINIYEKETPKGLEKFLKIKKMLNQQYLQSEMRLKKERLET